LRQYFDEGIGDLKDLVPFEKIFEERWLNVTYEITKILAEMGAKVEQIRRDLEAIEAKSEYEKDIKAIYFRSLNLGEALKENEIRKQEKAKVEEREKVLQQQKEAAQARQPQQTQLNVHPLVQPQEEPKPPMVDENGETLYEMAFKVTATKQQLMALKEFFLNNKIQFGRIK
jgi:hypothetical protein